MLRHWLTALTLGALVVAAWQGTASTALAQRPDMTRYYHYPYHYFPHNYWPSQGPQWPEPVGGIYRGYPAYMAYPAFKEPHWRYELWESQHYHRGFHFWLDQF